MHGSIVMVNGLKKTSYHINLPIWNGPMDLFLDLIKTSKLNISEISINAITNQYLLTLEILKKLNLPLTSDFLVMAATLILIKSRKLLPQEEKELVEIAEIRKNLIESLLTYEKYKNASKKLKGLENENALAKETNDSKKRKNLLPQKKSPNIWKNIGTRELMKATMRLVDLKSFHSTLKKITFIPISEKIAFIEQKLSLKKAFVFTELFNQNTHKREIIVTFWALLELYKNGKINLKQQSDFQEIRISPA